MPAPPRFASESRQKAAIAVAMAVVFAAAMTLAVLYTNAHYIDWSVELELTELDGITLKTPVGWEQRRREPRPGEAGDAVIFDDPQTQGRSLQVVPLAVETPQTPINVIRLVLADIQRSHHYVARWQDEIERFEVGHGGGARFTALTQREVDEPLFSDHIAVVTDNGRRHWLIYLRAVTDSTQRSIHANDELLTTICRSVVLGGTRLATPRDLSRVMLAMNRPVGADMRIDRHRRDARPPVLFFPDALPKPALGFVRVRGEIDTAVDDPKLALSPTNLLAAVFVDIHGRKPVLNADLKSDTDRAQPQWRMMIHRGAQQSLVRELRYVRLGAGRGCLMELLAEPEAYEQVGRLADDLADALAPLAPEAAISPAGASSGDGDDAPAPPTPIITCLAAGRRIVAAQRGELDLRVPNGWRYFAVRYLGHVIGAQVDWWYREPYDNEPLRGRRLTVRDANQQMETVWWAGPDGSLIDTVWWRQAQQGFVQQRESVRLLLKGDVLSMYDRAFVTERPAWAVQLDQPYLPAMAEQAWSLPALAEHAAARPALLWRSQGRGQPQPFWLDAASLRPGESDPRHAADNAPDAPDNDWRRHAAAALTIRPMMAMDGRTLWLDAQGAVLGADWHEGRDAPTGARRLSLEPVPRDDRSDLERAFPDLRGAVNRWQEETLNHE